MTTLVTEHPDRFVDRSLAFRAWLGRLEVSRAPHTLGLVALAPIACWLALPALIYLLSRLPEPLAGHFEGVVAITYVLFWFGIAATAVGVPIAVGAVGLALAVARGDWLAAAVNGVALSVGALIGGFIWLDVG
jgi:hypothetical protein